MGKLAQRLDILKLGTVSVDRTHIKANVSKHKSLRYDRIVELEAKLKAQFAEADEPADENDDDCKGNGDGRSGMATSAPTPSDTAQIDLTDGDSRVKRKSRYDTYTQAHNAQTAFDADGKQLILSTSVIQTPSDSSALEPAVAEAESTRGKV